ncbi:hypothetical protein KQX54_000028 [Cotesia glomerata]|uniref:Uncharacterized protein n=1 Tax=Cotesia glomerata TaxID=32391 RepID=A0AAV7ISJ7_COTGL|nr:hypothetical protein KQX54_000028 [Cotesia glomerata]
MLQRMSAPKCTTKHQKIRVFRARTPPEANGFKYLGSSNTHHHYEITPLAADCAHQFFNELRDQGTLLPNGRELPPLFNFTEQELRIQPNLNSQLLPKYMRSSETTTDAWTAHRNYVTATASASGNSTDSNVNTTTPSVTQNAEC